MSLISSLKISPPSRFFLEVFRRVSNGHGNRLILPFHPVLRKFSPFFVDGPSLFDGPMIIVFLMMPSVSWFSVNSRLVRPLSLINLLFFVSISWVFLTRKSHSHLFDISDTIWVTLCQIFVRNFNSLNKSLFHRRTGSFVVMRISKVPSDSVTTRITGRRLTYNFCTFLRPFTQVITSFCLISYLCLWFYYLYNFNRT